jgi:hypothetical protein
LRCRRAGLLVELLQSNCQSASTTSDPPNPRRFSRVLANVTRGRTLAHAGCELRGSGAELRSRSFGGFAVAIARRDRHDKPSSPRLGVSHPPVVASASPSITLRP